MVFAMTYAALWGLATLSSAHMIMSTPKPFQGVQQAPLNPDGSNFPCQMDTGGSYQSQGSTTMAKGSPQELSSGGSCQVSITYDIAPTKNSVWKVIHSIQGGCPAKNQEGNMGDSATAVDPFTYQYQIPDDIPTGNATIAWTWLNRIGNREYYMNCGPIVITGSSGAKSSYDALPDMVVANIPAISSCSTEGLEGSDYQYPDPGSSVDDFNMVPLKPLNGNCGPTASGGSASSGSHTASGSPSSSTSAHQAPTTSAAQDSPTVSGGVFVTAPTGGSSSQAAQTTEAPPATQADPTSSASEVPGAGASAGSGSSGGPSDAETSGSACSPEGLWNCAGGTSFQQCGSGVWSPVQALAAGTQCTPGQSATLDIKVANGKSRRRVTRFSS